MTKTQCKRNLALADALDEYQQTTRRLRNGNRYCCLGVACDLYEKATGKGNWVITGNGDYLFDGHDGIPPEENWGIPPPSVCQWYGWSMMGGIPALTIQRITQTAVFFNDRGASFSEIADGFRELAESSL